MKQLLKSELNGTVLFKKVVMFLLAYIVCIIGMSVMMAKDFYLGYFLVLILLMVSAFALEFQFLSSLINVISIDDEKFEFTGSFGSFMAVCIKGLLLTIVTLGIYGAWFQKNVINYIADNTKFSDKLIAFNGTGGKLFKYILLSFFIPLIILVVILTMSFGDIFMSLADPYSSSSMASNMISDMIGFFVIYIGGVFVISSIYSFFMYKWYINFTFGNQDIKLEVQALKAIGFIFGQLILTLITFGIYAFAAEVTIFKYFTNKTILIDRSTSLTTPVYFVGKTGKGFGLLLGQTLLCIITIGIYIPWAYANIQNWFISNIEIGD